MAPAHPYSADRGLPRIPVLALGLALPLVPDGLADSVLAAACDAIRRHRPRLFARLEPLGQTAILIDPTDLPAQFLLCIDGDRTTLRLWQRSRVPAPNPAATIRGPLAALVDLLEGRVDGDALFFARTLAIEGDTTTIVTLRNVIEAEPTTAIDVLAAPLWPFDGVARAVAHRALDLCRAAEARLAAAKEAADSALRTRVEAQERELGRIAARVAELEARGRRT